YRGVGGDPVRWWRLPDHGAGVQHQLVPRLLCVHGGSPDMNCCTARIVHATGHCSAAANAEPRELTLAFRMLGLALYTVLPLLSQPYQPMDFCHHAGPF
uniref:Uncharacterized protein n=1 Tax=Aegilops tauschii subsp. strangulata TaxID=200361 RepID=A0A453FT52_AEGTS